MSSALRQADLLIFPSTYEGFGLPVLEAMDAGCRWWRHESHSLPEVAGDAACYFDPLDIADMAAQIRKVARCSSTTRPASRGLTSSDDCLIAYSA
jgi:glycosyltransferase involved in cell wall biosynthesis